MHMQLFQAWKVNRGLIEELRIAKVKEEASKAVIKRLHARSEALADAYMANDEFLRKEVLFDLSQGWTDPQKIRELSRVCARVQVAIAKVLEHS